MSKPDRNLDRPPAAAEVAMLSELLAPETDVEFAYLFGSLVKGRPREGSDVDVAVRRVVFARQVDVGSKRQAGHAVED
jgi:predicted nucleotidyltransferase